ncbi:MAG: NTP transferase domain-containing protein [Lachnospiraceae bacterium]|nr:NTP transferase domain-containing protein [Lachnospiraceae bacterium]
MPALILAGGLGTRLKSVVNDRPKPMALVNEKPFLEYVLEELKKNGITDIIFAVGYKGSMVEDYFGDGSRFQMNIRYSYEDGQLGTAGAIKNASELINGRGFYVLNGDTYYKINYRSLEELNEKNNSIMTLVLRRVEDVSRYGRAVLDGERLTAFNEKMENRPKQELKHHSKKKGKKKQGNLKQEPEKTAGTINGGIYYMTPQILDYIPDGKVSLENEVIPELLKQDCFISGIVNEGYFIDIGIPEDYFKFQQDIQNLIDSE